MRELGAVGIGFRDQFAGNVQLHVVAVGTDHGLGESYGFITARPMKCGLEYDFFRRIALRSVETGGRLWLPEDVGDAVVADSVARAEISVRVVVEGAPADAARILWIRRQLVMDARVAQGVFREAFDLIDGFRGIGVPDELGVQVARMIGRLQREAEIVHGENIFQKFGLLEVADAASLARGIEFVRQGVGADVEIVIVLGLVDANTPENDGGMVPIAPDHASDVVNREKFPRLVADSLPTGNFLEDQKADFIACVEEVPRLRIVGGAYDIALQFVAKNISIP